MVFYYEEIYSPKYRPVTTDKNHIQRVFNKDLLREDG